MKVNSGYVELFDLSGQTALVVGGARDLGRDASDVLASAGASVAVTSRSLEHAALASQEISGQYGVETLALALDHTQPLAVDKVFNQVEKWRGRLRCRGQQRGWGYGQK